ncbi:MAG: hypothetical protein ACLUGI_03475 [Subdoligranulum sp.]
MKTAERRDGMMMCMCSLLRQPVPVFPCAHLTAGVQRRRAGNGTPPLLLLYKYFIPAFIWIERVGYQ